MSRLTRRLTVAAVLCFLLCPPRAAFALSPEELLEGVDGQKRALGADLSYDIELVTVGGGKAERRSKLRVFRRDSAQLLAALVLEPEAEKGEGYLRRDENLWFFDAETGAFVHRVLTDALSGSEMDSGDMEPDSLRECYSVAGVEEGKVGSIAALALELRERGPQCYPRMRVWLRASDGLLLKEEYYGASGRMLRYALYPSHLRLAGRTIPRVTVYVDALDPGSRTTATVTSPSLEPIPDSVFVKSFLERAR
jgi:hypothetical protein